MDTNEPDRSAPSARAGNDADDPGVVGDPGDPGVADRAAAGDVVPIDLRDYVSFSPDAATRVRALAGSGVALDLWCVEPQQSTGVLQYPDADVVYTVIGGRSWVVTEQGEIGLDPMGSLLVPAATVHGIDNRGADPLIVSMAMGPPDRLAARVVDGQGLAIRDDEQHGRWRRNLRRSFERLLGR